MFNRLTAPSLERSFFLFGPRSVGKSTLLKNLLPESKALWFDLLDPELEAQLQKSPARFTAILNEELSHQNKRDWIVVDEIQKVPSLLSIAQQFIQKKKFRFAFTGSSARKLKRGGANLLGGRASWFELYSLTHVELGKAFDLEDTINWGTLPEIFDLSEEGKIRFLKSYFHVYIKEEIVAEQLVRKVQPFRNFLELAALQNSQIINYSKFAKDCGVDTTTLQTYFEILEDTLLGFHLQPFNFSIRKRQRKNPKFYFFDTGVTRALANLMTSKLMPQTQTFGKYFEQFIITEIIKLARIHEKSWKFSYLTTQNGSEIDLVIELSPKKNILLEIKSAPIVDLKEVASFSRLARDIPNSTQIYLSCDPKPQKYGPAHCLHWQDAIKRIFEEK